MNHHDTVQPSEISALTVLEDRQSSVRYEMAVSHASNPGCIPVLYLPFALNLCSGLLLIFSWPSPSSIPHGRLGPTNSTFQKTTSASLFRLRLSTRLFAKRAM